MKKLILLIIAVLSFGYARACADFDPEYEYYNLFMQELVSDPQYYPFLLTYYPGYYTAADSLVAKNENIEEWQHFLGLNYDQAYYLVNKSKRKDLLLALQGGKTADPRLQFLTPLFLSNQKKSLLYLAYAKYLEPYMVMFSEESNGWSYKPDTTIANLNYTKAVAVLTKSWQAESDKEIKLRYGYQLVRIAHYKKQYQTALKYFADYVESLNYKPAIYYYALDQKAGAESGLKLFAASNYDFFQVFTHTRNRKESAFQSIRFSKTPDYTALLSRTKTSAERNDLYLMLGYFEFNNPLSSIKKIVQTSPDAVQAKVLMARAINSIEREYIPTGNYFDFCDTCYLKTKDKRFPVVMAGDKSEKFFHQLIAFSHQMTTSPKVKEKDFWNLTSAYLYFLNKDFHSAKSYLVQVKEINKLYAKQKQNLAIYIDICEQPRITDKVERLFYVKYKLSFDIEKDNTNSLINNFLEDVLANRYYLQQDYAKSFLLHNDITSLEQNPDLSILDAIDALYQKSGKNDFEKLLLKRLCPRANPNEKRFQEFDIQSYINNMRGTIYLSRGELIKALEAFKKVKPGFTQFDLTRLNSENTGYYWPKSTFDGFSGISKRIFGSNILERFSCAEDTVMSVAYLNEFPIIKSLMNKRELTETIISLESMATQNNEQAAKAAYLLANFFYNTTNTGYYRHILRFDQDNFYCEKYSYSKQPNVYNNIYLKFFGVRCYYNNDVSLSQQFLEKALLLAQDNELKARIIFALSKCEQGMHYQNLFKNENYFWVDDNDILIKNRKYFKSLMQFKNTAYYNEVSTNCLYFNYYTSHY